MSGRNATTVRTLTVLALLEKHPQGMTIDEIHRALEDRGYAVDKRTVYRDRDALNEIGFPIYEEDDADESGAKTGKKRLCLNSKARVNDYLVLNSKELFALYFSKGMLKPLENTPFYADIEEIFKKIEDKLGKKAVEYIGEVAKELRFSPGLKWGIGINPDVLETLRSATTERHILQIEYLSASSSKRTTRKVGPHFLYFHAGSLYLVAEDLGDNKIKTFAVPRMTHAEMLEETYSTQSVEPEEHYRHSFGIFRGEEAEDLVIEFSPKIGPYVKERVWHKTQQSTTREGGAVQLRLQVAITPEVIAWVLGFGSEACVTKPLSLVTRLREEAAKLLETYKSSKAA
jgi:predicted DNA-binding transcriptional regulator YafY